MKGATTEPWEATRMTAKDTRITAKGSNQYFFLATAYLYICFNIDRISGKSIFAIPECGGVEAEAEPECDGDPSIFNCGYSVYFNVEPGGSLSFVGNIK